MQFTAKDLIEEYHLPSEPVQLKSRLSQIIKVLRKSNHPLNVQKVLFLENWMNGIAEPAKPPLPIRGKTTSISKPRLPVGGKQKVVK